MSDKPITFWGSSQKDLREFPEDARSEAGYQLRRVQQGHEPDNWKPLSDIGHGVAEIRITANGEYRVVYIAKFDESVYVLHAFGKKTRKTSQSDIDLARKRLKEIEAARQAAKKKR